MAEYPEHAKLKLVKDKSQAIGEFLDWISGEKGWHLAYYHTHSDACDEPHKHQSFCGQTVNGDMRCRETDRVCDMGDQTLYSAHYGVQKLLGEFFEIDLKKLEAEKEAMLDEIRAATKAGVPSTPRKSL